MTIPLWLFVLLVWVAGFLLAAGHPEPGIGCVRVLIWTCFILAACLAWVLWGAA